MRKLLNSLYILDETAWLTLDGENIVCKTEDKEKFRLPFANVSTVDASGRKRLRKIAKICQNYGQRVQNSVFEIDVDYGTFLKVKDQLMKAIEPKADSLRIYYLGNHWEQKKQPHVAPLAGA